MTTDPHGFDFSGHRTDWYLDSHHGIVDDPHGSFWADFDAQESSRRAMEQQHRRFDDFAERHAFDFAHKDPGIAFDFGGMADDIHHRHHDAARYEAPAPPEPMAFALYHSLGMPAPDLSLPPPDYRLAAAQASRLRERAQAREPGVVLGASLGGGAILGIGGGINVGGMMSLGGDSTLDAGIFVDFGAKYGAAAEIGFGANGHLAIADSIHALDGHAQGFGGGAGIPFLAAEVGASGHYSGTPLFSDFVEESPYGVLTRPEAINSA